MWNGDAMPLRRKVIAYILNFFFLGAGFIVAFGGSGTFWFLFYFIPFVTLNFVFWNSGEGFGTARRFSVAGCSLLWIVSFIHLYIAIREGLQGTGAINEFFEKAVRIYILTHHEDAKIAARAAAKMATIEQRNSMIRYLDFMIEDYRADILDDPAARPAIEQMEELQREIHRKVWSERDIVEEKRALQKANPEYLCALDEASTEIFVKKYPELFMDE